MSRAQKDAGSRTLPADLVETKLVPPSPDPRSIRREPLVTSSGDGWHQVTAIVAPAGSGKSTLMAQMVTAFGATGLPSCWLSLDAEDNDPATFAIYFISAQNRIDPGFAHDELIALEANPVRDFDQLFNRLLGRLTVSETSRAIFLDDFQHLSDKHILRFLDKLIVRSPHGLHLVIASRAILPLQLVRLRVAGRLAEIGPDKLNFNRDQTERFLKFYHGLELAPLELDALLSSTEGWPAGVQLVALALHQHSGSADKLIRAFSNRDGDLMRYLAENVLRNQTEDVRRFLLHSSPLRRMCAELCRAATEQDNAEACLHYLGQANLFLISLDREGIWFRYHHLFGDFLKREFRRADPEAYRETCRRAADWCEDHGEPTEAIRYTLESGNHHAAAKIIARHALRTSMYQGDHYTMLGWLRRLPLEYHDQYPEIMLAHAWSLAFSRDTAQAITITQHTLSLLKEERWKLLSAERDQLELLTLNTEAAALACADAIKDCLERASDLRNKVSKDQSFVIATLSNCLGYGHFVKRDFSRSRTAAIDAHQYGHRANAAYLSAWGDFLHGLADVELGQLSEAQNLCRSVQRDSEALALGQKSYIAGLSALLDTEIAIQRYDFKHANESIAVGRMFKEIYGPVEPQLVATRCEARLLAGGGKLDEARVVLQEGQDDALREHYPRLCLALGIEEVLLQLNSDDLPGAIETSHRWHLRDLPSRVSIREPLWSGQYNMLRLVEARFRLAESNYSGALRILTQLKQAPDAETRGGFFMAATAYRAIAYWGCGRRQEAVRELDKALAAAAAEFHTWPLVSAGPALEPIIELLAERRAESDVSPETLPRLSLQNWLLSQIRGEAKVHLAAHQTASVAAAENSTAIEMLTAREMELLRLLQAGLNNHRLADALFLSESTVKWHLHNIYAKLEVSSRGEAVARARQAGIIQ
ncbi:MAG: hypothetical protein EPN72_02790 [Nevskiaceae bacterium]|nr:MAG: hypothetical protein EPN63_13165 [Nevskiaceae bacterium]TBR74242.1 MAG: hypothetical protein EPN72_02790 [Nevskiaceae bacterium]